ncbi:hypothetical protein LB467_02875 [Salegentibacter sp. JZCK2]|uniref:hypothetical protein n=1 Tax=Salegentibacter tibetensis TaxID=2873600 RepID=UPI001CCFB8F6|nr:hypothetical protein [Salegentibacter tibetensis]MBZ9728617.1 hypothetical protein [Salegentibacter tibetensis]
MDLQTRKLNLITYLAQLQDEKLISKIEDYILKKNSNEKNADLDPFTIEELISRVEKSEQDYKQGRFKTQKELEKLSENW